MGRFASASAIDLGAQRAEPLMRHARLLVALLIGVFLVWGAVSVPLERPDRKTATCGFCARAEDDKLLLTGDDAFTEVERRLYPPVRRLEGTASKSWRVGVAGSHFVAGAPTPQTFAPAAPVASACCGPCGEETAALLSLVKGAVRPVCIDIVPSSSFDAEQPAPSTDFGEHLASG